MWGSARSRLAVLPSFGKCSLIATDEPRVRVLAAALRCFARKGFAGTTITDIEAEAGLSPGAGGTYRHFTSKLEMLEAAVADVLARSDAEWHPSRPL